MGKINHVYTDELIQDFHEAGEQPFFVILVASICFYSFFALWAYSIPTPEIEVPQFPRETPRTARFILPTPEPKEEIKQPLPPALLPEKEKRKTPAPRKPDNLSPPSAVPESPQAPERVHESDRDIAMKSGLLKLLASRTSPQAKNRQESLPPIENLIPPANLPDRENVPLTFQEKLMDEPIALPEVRPDVQEFQLSGRATTVIENPFRILGIPGGEMIRSEASILQVIQAHQNGLTYLYNKALQSQPGLKGNITIEFTILARGEVARLKIISSTLNEEGFVRSIRRHILEWRFEPIPEGEVVVVYPIGFSPA